ncbi:unnamed protein product [Aspergillus oryzae var. brunneus]|uniref:Unnamed protein product n=2 Tax=Aspergillus oryzae TaxID=5062 RepID=A0AAN4YKR7_ASPOZ|nr:unnamed protein product [Aspergillus oryzae]GMG42142.1 unnamed protein product [Aspergillus oryzae var. brunneus]
MSSTSPSKEPEVEPEVQSGEEQEQMDKEQQDQAQNQGEFEVKEQDRGEHQNRPTSSGYASGGPVGGVSSAPGGRPATAGGFPDAADNTNSIMNPSLDPTEQDPSAYGYPPMVGQPHNGTAGDSY